MKKILFVISMSILAFLFSFVTCRKRTTNTNSYATKAPASAPTPVPIVATYSPSCNSLKSYSIEVKPLFENYCISCHSDYSSYAEIITSSSSIRNAIVNGFMPKGSTLTAAQKNSIVCWIDAGTPNN